MKALFLLMIAAGAALVAWYVASRISPDAISMAVGMLFGVLAGVPTTMLAMAGSRRRDYDEPPTRTQYIQHTHTHTGLLPDSQHGQYIYKPVEDNDPLEW